MLRPRTLHCPVGVWAITSSFFWAGMSLMQRRLPNSYLVSQTRFFLLRAMCLTVCKEEGSLPPGEPSAYFSHRVTLGGHLLALVLPLYCLLPTFPNGQKSDKSQHF